MNDHGTLFADVAMIGVFEGHFKVPSDAANMYVN